jgi:hypothetical protein
LVEVAAGERIGHVAHVSIGDPSQAESSNRSLGFLGGGRALALGARPEPRVAPEMVGKLFQVEFINVDDTRRSRPDQHLYALANEIVSVGDETVGLAKVADE